MKPNPISKQLSEFTSTAKIAQIARTVGLSRRGLRACLSPDKPRPQGSTLRLQL